MNNNLDVTNSPETAAYSYTPQCLVCRRALEVRLAKGRRSEKPFVMLVCPNDGRHFRGFISHQPYVKEVLDKLASNRDKDALGRGEAA